MILNQATDIRYGAIGQEAVYSGSELVWPMIADYIYKDSTLLYYLRNESSLTVPKKIKRNAIDTIGATCYNYDTNITSVIIENNITEID